MNPNSLAVQDKAGRTWKVEFDYVEPKFHEYDFKPRGITCDGAFVKFPDLFEPMALALANDGQLMVADSQTSPRQQVLFYDVSKVVVQKPVSAGIPPGEPAQGQNAGKDADAPRMTRAFGDYGDYQANEFAPNTERVKSGPFWVDKKGNIWMAYGFIRYDFQGLDANGNPIYAADKITVLDPPKGVKKIARVVYLDDSDTLIVADESSDMRHISRVFICKDYLKGNRETVSLAPPVGKEAGCVAAVGDCVFTGGWKECGRIGVNRLSDGAEVGVFDPGETIGGNKNAGWIDVLTGITAHQRKDGEYLVFVEEDYKAKVLVYRWRPCWAANFGSALEARSSTIRP